MIHSRMVVGMARYQSRFPNADVVLFEPEREEYRLFFSNIFSFEARRQVCEIAYRATRRDLWRRRDTLAPMLQRHGLTLRLDLLQDQERSVWEGIERGRVEARAPVADRLSLVLTRLETATAGRPRQAARRFRRP